MISPDTQDVLDAISVIKGGACIVPEDLDATVSHILSSLGPDAIARCVGKTPEAKRWFLIGVAFERASR